MACHKALAPFVPLDTHDVIREVCERVRIAVCEEDRVIVILELVRES